MAHVAKDIGMGVGALLLAMTGLGAAGIGPMAAMMGGGAGAAGAGGAAGAAGAGAAGGTAAGGAATGAAGGLAGGATEGLLASSAPAATFAVPAGAEAAGAGASSALPAFTSGAAAAHPGLLAGIGDASMTSAKSMPFNMASQALLNPKQSGSAPAGGALPQTNSSFEQLMTMFPQQNKPMGAWG